MGSSSSRRQFLKLVGGSAAAVSLTTTLQPNLVTAAGINAGPSLAPDQQMQAVLNEIASFNAPPIESTVPRVARDFATPTDAVASLLSKQGKPTVEQIGRVEHRIFAGPGSPLLVRIYTPQGNGPFPVAVYFHGGGFVIANLDTYDPSCRALANAAGCIVVSVAYRQAPEYKFPAAPLDALAAYKWVLANAASFNGDPNRVAVAGESAGGNLATGVAIQARDQGLKLPLYQLLVYPVTDFAGNYASYEEFAAAKPLNTGLLKWFGGYYLRGTADRTNRLASPLLTPSLSGLPPAWLITAETDPLRDQGEAYKDRLLEAGVQTGGARYTGVTHEFFGMGAVVDTAKQAVAEAAAAMRRAFGTV